VTAALRDLRVRDGAWARMDPRIGMRTGGCEPTWSGGRSPGTWRRLRPCSLWRAVVSIRSWRARDTYHLLTEGRCPPGSRRTTIRSSRGPAGTVPAAAQMRAAPNPRALTRVVWGLTARPPVSPAGFPPVSRLPAVVFPVAAFLWSPVVRRCAVRSLRPWPGSGPPSVSLRVPFPLSIFTVALPPGGSAGVGPGRQGPRSPVLPRPGRQPAPRRPGQLQSPARRGSGRSEPGPLPARSARHAPRGTIPCPDDTRRLRETTAAATASTAKTPL
jgi:hypothetical protein